MIGYRLHIVGSAPGLIMNSPQGYGKDTKVPEPEAEAKAKRYCLPPSKKFPKGELYIPGEWLMAALTKTASNIFKVKMQGKVTLVRQWLAGTSFINPGCVPLGIQDYEVFCTTAVVNQSRVMRARPRIFPWEAEFVLQFSDDDALYEDICLAMANVMLDLWKMTGIKTGIGDNRPSAPKKPGPHGRFTVKTCELIA